MRFEELVALERDLARHNMLLHREAYASRPGTVSENKVALVGGGGHVFIGEGGNAWTSQLCGRIDPSYDLVGHWVELLERRAAAARAHGTRLVQLIVPEKQTVLHAFIGHDIPPRSWLGRPAARIMSAAVPGLRPIYPAEDMGREQLRAELFWRGNSHWCASGCTIAARSVLDGFGVAWDDELVVYRRSVIQHDLLRHLRPQVPFEEVIVVGTPGVLVHEHRPYAETGRHEGSCYTIRNDRWPPDRKLVIFGDSCSFDAGLAYGLSSFFFETHFVWNKNVDWGYVARAGAGHVLWECAERFLLTPSDD